MTAKEIFELRKQGSKEEAYEEARLLYATDKSGYASAAMFWTAVDILRSRVNEGKTDEAKKILLALERLQPNVPDKDGWVQDAMSRCRSLLEKGIERHHRIEDGDVNMTVGTWGEELAATYLHEKGYVILERDWHSGHRDIDIIAQNNEWLVPRARHQRDFAHAHLGQWSHQSGEFGPQGRVPRGARLLDGQPLPHGPLLQVLFGAKCNCGTSCATITTS